MRLVARGHLALLAALDLLQLAAEVADPLLDQPAVFLQLFLARPAKPHALLLTRKVRPHPLQARHGVLMLGQFDRQPGLIRLRAAGENVEDQLRPVQHLHPGRLLEVPGLGRRQIVVEDDHVGVGGRDHRHQLVELPFAEVTRGVGRLAALGQASRHADAGRYRQPLQLVQRRLVGMPIGQQNADQNPHLADNVAGDSNSYTMRSSLRFRNLYYYSSVRDGTKGLQTSTHADDTPHSAK